MNNTKSLRHLLILTSLILSIPILQATEEKDIITKLYLNNLELQKLKKELIKKDPIIENLKNQCYNAMHCTSKKKEVLQATVEQDPMNQYCNAMRLAFEKKEAPQATDEQGPITNYYLKIQKLEKELNEKDPIIKNLKEEIKNDVVFKKRAGRLIKALSSQKNLQEERRIEREKLENIIKSNEEERDLYYKSLLEEYNKQIKKIDKEHAAKQLIMENKIEKLKLENQQLKTQKTSNQKNFNNNLKIQNKRLQIHHLSNKNKPELEDLLPRLNEENIDNKPQEKSFLKAIASLCVYFSLSFKTKSNNN